MDNFFVDQIRKFCNPFRNNACAGIRQNARNFVPQ